MNPPEPQPEPIIPLASETAGKLRRRSSPPLMTFALIAANLLMAFAQWAASGYPSQFDALASEYADWVLGAKVPSLIAHGEYWRLVTASFLHASLLHLTVNMVGLLILGQLVELFYGRLRLLAIYVLACVAGTAASYLFTPDISLGASTGGMGLVGAVLLHNLRYRRYLPPRVNAAYPMLWVIVAVEFGIDMRPGSGVDLWGHVGGLLGGILMAALMESRLAGQLQNERDWLPLPTAVGTALLLLIYGAYGVLQNLPAEVQFLRAMRSQSPPRRLAALEAEIQRRPYFMDARLALILEQVAMGQLEVAKQNYFQALRQNSSIRTTHKQFVNAMAQGCLAWSTALYQRADWEAALRASDQVLDLEPTGNAREGGSLMAQAQNQSAWILVDKLERDLGRAEKLAAEAVKADPKVPATIDTLAWIYYKQGRYQDALAQQQKALEIVSRQPLNQNGEYYYHLGAIWEKMGRPREAIANYTLAIQGNSPPAAEALKRLSPPAPPSATPPPPAKRDPVAERGLI